MNGRLGTWSEVKRGAYVQDKQGTTWRVEDQRGAQLLLVRPDDKRVMQRPPGDTPVTLMEPNDEEALAVVQNLLGAEVVAEKEPGKPWVCPPLPRRLDMIHTHFFQMHGVWTRSGPGSKSVEKLLEQHREDHLADEPASHAWVNHEHH